MLHLRRARQRRVQLEVGEVGQPDERRQVLAEAERDVALVAAREDVRGLHPRRGVRRAALLVEELVLHAVGIALQGERTVAQVRQQDRGDPRVVVDHLALREPRARVEDLVQIGERERLVADRDLEALGWGHAGDGTGVGLSRSVIGASSRSYSSRTTP